MTIKEVLEVLSGKETIRLYSYNDHLPMQGDSRSLIKHLNDDILKQEVVSISLGQVEGMYKTGIYIAYDEE